MNDYPMLRPSPMALGDLMSSTFNIFKKHWSTFLTFGAAMLGATLAAMIVGGSLFVFSVFSLVTDASLQRGGFPAGPIGLMVLSLVILIGLQMAVSLKFNLMMVSAAHEAAAGGQPTLGGAWNATRGSLRRLVVAVLLVLGILVAFFALSIIGVIVMLQSLVDGNGAAEGLLMGAVILFLAGPLLFIIAIYFQTRLLYVWQALAIEGLSVMDALRRSWALTSGAFWRTLGYFIVFQIVIGLPNYVFNNIIQNRVTQNVEGATSLEDLLNSVASAVFVVVWLIQLAWSVASWMLTYIYQTVMYIDQVRRSQGVTGNAWVPSYGLGPSPAGGYASAGGYPPATGGYRQYPPTADSYPDPWQQSQQTGYGEQPPAPTANDPWAQPQSNPPANDWGAQSGATPPPPPANDPWTQPQSNPSANTWGAQSGATPPPPPPTAGNSWNQPPANKPEDFWKGPNQ